LAFVGFIFLRAGKEGKTFAEGRDNDVPGEEYRELSERRDTDVPGEQHGELPERRDTDLTSTQHNGISESRDTNLATRQQLSENRHRALPDRQQNGLFTLGAMSFNIDTRKLMINGETIELTRTESRVLGIFALSPNEIIARSRLQKEIWEDDGVIVGRSLDMFISKLRKKLEPDPKISIVVIRGKGYKLEISA